MFFISKVWLGHVDVSRSSFPKGHWTTNHEFKVAQSPIKFCEELVLSYSRVNVRGIITTTP